MNAALIPSNGQCRNLPPTRNDVKSLYADDLAQQIRIARGKLGSILNSLECDSFSTKELEWCCKCTQRISAAVDQLVSIIENPIGS